MGIFDRLFNKDNSGSIEVNDTDSLSENQSLNDLKTMFPSLVEAAASGIYGLNMSGMPGAYAPGELANAIINEVRWSQG